MRQLCDVKQLKELTNVEDVNKLLQEGWELSRVFNTGDKVTYILAKY